MDSTIGSSVLYSPPSKLQLCSLPPELLMQILQFLSSSNLCTCAQLNKFFNLVCNDPVLWRSVCIRDIETPDQSLPRLPPANESNAGDEGYPTPTWKEYYMASFALWNGTWDSDIRGKGRAGLRVSKHGIEVSHEGPAGYQSIRGYPSLSGIGSHYWEVKVTSLYGFQSGFHLVIGVVPESFTSWTTYLSDKGGWGYLANGYKAHNSGPGVIYGKKFVQGDRVGVHVDMSKKTLSFFVNGIYQGVAYNNIDSIVYPAVSLLSAGQKVELVHTKRPRYHP